MSNVISSQFFKAGKIKGVKVTTIFGLCFVGFIVLMCKMFSEVPITGMDMFDTFSQSFMYLFLVVFANHIISADWTSSSIKQILGKGTDRVSYCIGTMFVAVILTFVYEVLLMIAGFALGSVVGEGIGVVDIKSVGFILGGYLLISCNFVSIIMFLYCFIKKSAAVIMIVSFMPIISDLLSTIVIGMTGIENAAYISYFKLMEDVTRANPDSTQNVVSYVVLTAITIFFAAASAIVLRKEDIN